MFRLANLLLDIINCVFKHLIIALPWIILGIGVIVWASSKLNGL